MSRIYRSLPPKGTKLGIAFSGGLDTLCAGAWLNEQGMHVYAYTADLAQPDEANPADIPKIALDHGAKAAKLVDCREALVREGLLAIQCGAFHLSVGGKKYFTAVYADTAVAQACVSCHNGHKDSPRKDFKLGDVMGGVVIRIPMN